MVLGERLDDARRSTKWCVLKRKEDLTSEQQLRVRDLLRYRSRIEPMRRFVASSENRSRPEHHRCEPRPFTPRR